MVRPMFATYVDVAVVLGLCAKHIAAALAPTHSFHQIPQLGLNFDDDWFVHVENAVVRRRYSVSAVDPVAQESQRFESALKLGYYLTDSSV